MFSKAKLGMLLGTMAAVLSIGSLGSAFAADTTQTQAQAQKLEKPSEVKFAFGGKMNHHGGGIKGVSFKENTELLSLLKLDADKLAEELKAGKSLAAVAEAQGVSVDDLVSLLVEQQEAKLKEAVTAGKLTQEQADKMNENAAERVKEMVQNTHQDRGPGKGFGFGGGFDKNEELLSLLKLDADKLGEELKAGKSLAAVAEAQGVSVDDLVSLLVEQQEAKLKEAVTAGKLTQEQADKMNENAADRVQKMVEGSFTKGAFRGHGEKKAEQDKAGEQ
jgi:lipoate-protein ligase A